MGTRHGKLAWPSLWAPAMGLRDVFMRLFPSKTGLLYRPWFRGRCSRSTWP